MDKKKQVKRNLKVANLRDQTPSRDADPNNSKSANMYSSDESLGILDNDHIKSKAFHSKENLNTTRSSEASNKLEDEKRRAMKLLSNTPIYNSTPKGRGNITDYVPMNSLSYMESIQFDDNKTIDARPKEDIDVIKFSTDEISGRSTMKAYTKQVPVSSPGRAPTLEEILASSCSEDVRKMGESFRESTASLFTGKRSSQSGSRKTSNSYTDCTSPDRSTRSSEFIPAENARDMLQKDEVLWEQEYRAIPSMPASDNVSIKGSIAGQSYTSHGVDTSRMSKDNSRMSKELSIGQFFYKGSHDLYEMIPNQSPRKNQSSCVALIDYASDDRDSIADMTNGQDVNASQLTKTIDKSTVPMENSSISGSMIVNAIKDWRSPNYNKLMNILMEKKQNKGSIKAHSSTLSEITDQLNTMNLDEQHTQTLRESVLSKGTAHTYTKDKENTPIPTDLSSTASFNESSLNRPDLQFLKGKKIDPIESPKVKNRKRSRSFARIDGTPRRGNTVAVEMEETENSPSAETEVINNVNDEAVAGPSYSIHIKNRTDVETFVEDAIAYSKTINNKQQNQSYAGIYTSPHSSKNIETNSTMISPVSTENNRPRALSESPLGNKASLAASPRCMSRCSSNTGSTTSIFSHRDGILPLKSTHSEVCWGSVKLRKTVTKTIQIKNTSEKRLLLRIEVIGPGFQICDHVESNSLTLQPQECKSINIRFCPTVIGIARGKVCFRAPKETQRGECVIHLLAYGGNASVILENIEKGPIGPAFIELGDIKDIAYIPDRSFDIYNRGPLTAFAYIKVVSKHFDEQLLQIVPQRMVLQPESRMKVTISFKPRSEIIRKILKKKHDVFTLATLNIICGDEPTRYRINRLTKLMNNQMSQSLKFLTESYPGEDGIMMHNIKEKTDAINELFGSLKSHEVAATLTNSCILEESMDSSVMVTDMDDTIKFKTLLPDSSMLQNKTIMEEPEDVLPFDAMNAIFSGNSASGESWCVHPSRFYINLVDQACLRVHSNLQTPQLYEIDSNYRDLFDFDPSEGEILPGQNVSIGVRLSQRINVPRNQIFIMILIENEKITVPVFINGRC